MMLLCIVPMFAHQVLPADLTYPELRFTETPPPPAPVRPVAEFEPASHVLIRYPLGIPVSLVVQLANTAQVICIVSSSQQNAATSAFNNAGVNMANVSFMNAATDSYWTRDYGPWFVYDGNGIFSVMDFVYNRPRPNDNMIPQLFATQQNWNYYGMNLQQTGGNYMNDGIAAGMQTTLVYEENGNNQTNVNTKMHDYLGLESYHVIADPNNTYIDHIDCWAKLLAPDKVLVRSVPTSHAQYDEIEAAANYFATHNCSWGYPYRVYRVNTPSNQPYTNSLILNKRVFVPTVGGAYDAAALQVYRDAMPGYEVIGVPQSGSAPWESTDALHCRTHEIPDKNMLHLAHIPRHGIVDPADSLDFSVDIIAHSGQSLYSDSLFISYKIANGPWQRSMLLPQNRNSYSGWISGYAAGDTIRYYIHAADQSGRSYDHPVYAALDPHLFVIQPDMEAPVITHTPLTTIANQAQPVSFIATVTDNIAVSQVLFRYRIDNGPSLQIPMDNLGGNMYSFEFYTAFEPQDEYLYYSFIAYDNANPPNMQMAPPDNAWWQVEVLSSANSDQYAPEVEGITAVYPNPFNLQRSAQINIAYASKINDASTLKIFNIKGQLVHEQRACSQKGKEQIFTWNGRDLNGNSTTSGLYLIQISSAGKTHKSKLIITK